YYCSIIIFYFKSGNGICLTFTVFICTFTFLYIVITRAIVIFIGDDFQRKLPVFHRQFLAVMPCHTFFKCKCIYLVIFCFPSSKIRFILHISIDDSHVLMNKIIYLAVNSASGKAINKESFRGLVNCICY